MPPIPRLEVVQPSARQQLRRRVPALGRPTPTGIAAACLVVGLAAIAVSLALVYLPAGILAAGLELAGGAIAYTRGAGAEPARRRR
jgi:predicted lysophospholipase L1 biosynthesis ABC-type transport system permease subunit